MNAWMLLLDVSPDPEVSSLFFVLPVLMVVFVLSVAIVAVLVFFGIRHKRRSLSTQESKPIVSVDNLT